MPDSFLQNLPEIGSAEDDDLLFLTRGDGESPESFLDYCIRRSNLGGDTSPSLQDFRLTLASGHPVYSPQPATPSATDTGTEVITFAAAHGWVTGTRFTVSATGGNLTAGTVYYLNALSGTTIAAYTTLADALADTSRVNLSASITAVILPSGVEGPTLYLSPYIGNRIALYGGTAWASLASAEISLALGTLSANANYDVFAYDNGGTLTMELSAAWASATVRTDAIVRQDGAWVKSGATTRRLVGTIRTNATTTTVDDAGGLATRVGGRRFVWNVNNRVDSWMRVFEGDSTYTYNSDTIRQANGQSGNRVEYVCGLNEDAIEAVVHISMGSDGSAVSPACGIGIDSTTVFSSQMHGGTVCNSSAPGAQFSGFYRAIPSIGYHALNWLERGSGSEVITFHSNNTSDRKGGMMATLRV